MGLTDLVAALVLDRIANGESLRSICTSDGLWPAASVFIGWATSNPERHERYVRACQSRAFVRLDDAYADIADPTNKDMWRSRMKYDAAKWEISKLVNNLFGDRLTVDQTTRTIEPDKIDMGEAATAYTDAMRGRVTLQ